MLKNSVDDTGYARSILKANEPKKLVSGFLNYHNNEIEYFATFSLPRFQGRGAGSGMNALWETDGRWILDDDEL